MEGEAAAVHRAAGRLDRLEERRHRGDSSPHLPLLLAPLDECWKVEGGAALCYLKEDRIGPVSRRPTMIRLSRLTDYGIMLLTLLARDRNGAPRSAREIADRSRLPRPTVSKLLKALAHGGVLETHRG